MTIDYCGKCKWLLTDLRCLAFPDGIPKEILRGEIGHDTVIEGQQGKEIPIIYEEDGNW